MRELMLAVGLLAAGYLCGSIPFGLLVGWAKGVDIRTRGSGNIGATNVGRVLGWPLGVLVFVLDLLKGLLPTLLGGMVIHRHVVPAGDTGTAGLGCLLWVLLAMACILGHTFPAYMRFKGGKGVATALGTLLGIYPYFTWVGLAAFGVWVALTFLTRYVSVGSIGAAAAFPILFAFFAHARRAHWGPPQHLWPFHLFAIVIALLVVYRHRSNCRRLLQGSEPKIGAPHPGLS